jgi:sulfide:quinone oxidoreductase
LGSNFGGLTAALAVKLELEGDVDVTVVSPSPHFLLNPSLIWVPFGKRARRTSPSTSGRPSRRLRLETPTGHYVGRRGARQRGRVPIGATQGAGCFDAAYQFLFNTAYQLKKAGPKKTVKISYVTSEPFLGRFGIGGLPHGEQLLSTFLKKGSPPPSPFRGGHPSGLGIPKTGFPTETMFTSRLRTLRLRSRAVTEPTQGVRRH